MKRWIVGLVVVCQVVLAACGSQQPEAQPVSVKITSPTSGTTIAVGEVVKVEGEVSGGNVAQVRVRINGQTYQQIPATQLSTGLAFEWSAPFAGQHVIFVEAYDASNALIGRSDVLILKADVSQPKATATNAPTPTLPPQATTSPEVAATAVTTADLAVATAQVSETATVAPTEVSAATPTPAPTVAPTVAPTTAPTVAPTATPAVVPAVSVKDGADFVNLRSGPGTNYEIVGKLNKAEIATVVGKSADGEWWQVRANGQTAWVIGQLVQANAQAANVPVVKAPPSPTPQPTATTAATLVAIEPTLAPTTAAAAAPPGRPPCDPSNPWWGVKIHNDPGYTFCVPVPFQLVPNVNPDPDVIVLKWEIYGDIKSLELHMDPNGQGCGRGTTGFRETVNFKEDAYQLNTRFYPTGGYKLGLWAFMNDGRVQDWGEINFCGKG